MAAVGGELGCALPKEQALSSGTCASCMNGKSSKGFQNVLKPFSIVSLIQKTKP